MTGSFALRPEHIRRNTHGEMQANVQIQAGTNPGAATRFELPLSGGEKLRVEAGHTRCPQSTAPAQAAYKVRLQ
nr:TOBE domain-containing protein [Escherichia coli]